MVKDGLITTPTIYTFKCVNSERHKTENPSWRYSRMLLPQRPASGPNVFSVWRRQIAGLTSIHGAFDSIYTHVRIYFNVSAKCKAIIVTLLRCD